MALIARSIEMSFSLSRPRRTLRSMSILASPVPCPDAIKHRASPGAPSPSAPGVSALVLGAPGVGPAELDLHLRGAEFGVVQFDLVTVDVQGHRGVADRHDPALQGRRAPCSLPALTVCAR